MTEGHFPTLIDKMHSYMHPATGRPAPLISDSVHAVVMANADRIQEHIDYKRDFQFDYFGFKTLERSYLLKMDGVISERPQHMFMRVALGIHGEDLEAAFETYDLMSQKFFTHATPTLFNSGTPRPQLSSCFLLTMKGDSIGGIYDTLKQCAQISKYAGGIGLSIHNIRATGSYIGGTNGSSNGIVPMLRVFNDTARYVDQGGGKRKGSFAVYLEPWHDDIFEFLDLKKNHGKEEARARDLFYAMWISDLFMKRVEENSEWSLFCPNEAPGLADCHGEEFEALYTKYEREGRARRTVGAQKLWFTILQSQIETGTPYMLYKDACNAKSNQQNLGTIKSSNLCTEILEYTSPDEVAVCNLASIALPKFVRLTKNEDGDVVKRELDLEELVRITKVVTRNLNKVIDVNYYPVEEARTSNMRHRPIGIGVQGLADAFCLMRVPFDSPAAKKMNRDIFEAIYYGAMSASNEIAKEQGPYDTFKGSPASQGKFQFDLWGVTPSDLFDWDSLKKEVMEHGIRNSLMVAPMPTASTAQIMGNNEGIEPFTSNLYSRRVLAGDFTIVNKHMLRDLVERGLWTKSIRNQIMKDRGSIQKVAEIPAELKALYKTVWEIKQKDIIDMAADRGAFICQSQSLNIHIAAPTIPMLTSMHFYAWKRGLKTGMYYLRSKPKAHAIQFTVDSTKADTKLPEDAGTAAAGGGGNGSSTAKVAPPSAATPSSPALRALSSNSSPSTSGEKASIALGSSAAPKPASSGAAASSEAPAKARFAFGAAA